MKFGKTGRWLITAFGVFLGLLVIWVLAIFQLNPAGAGAFNLGFDLRSRLPADYSPDTASRQVGVLRFTIIGDVMRELGMAPDEAESYAQGMQESMSGPVPTATARDFSGSDPFTATPTYTPIPTDTPEPTATPTRTRRPATHTPRPTTAPTSAASTSAVTASPDDEEDPHIDVSGCCLDPDPGPIAACSVTFTIDNVHVTDASPSSGIEWVKFKYLVPGYVDVLTYSDPFTLDSGGATGGGWNGIYSGSLTIDIFPGWVGVDNPGPEDFEIHLWVRASDSDGNEDVLSLGYYYIPATCDDPPPPTPTS